jgi:co-chaperonin GroES (HSP10)
VNGALKEIECPVPENLDVRLKSDRVLILPKREERATTADGQQILATVGSKQIVSPQTAAKAAERPEEGRVVAVGPGRRNSLGELVPMETDVGEWVAYEKHSGSLIEIDGVEYLEMWERAVKFDRPSLKLVQFATGVQHPASPKPALPAETPRLDQLVEGDRPSYPPPEIEGACTRR